MGCKSDLVSRFRVWKQWTLTERSSSRVRVPARAEAVADPAHWNVMSRFWRRPSTRQRPLAWPITTQNAPSHSLRALPHALPSRPSQRSSPSRHYLARLAWRETPALFPMASVGLTAAAAPTATATAAAALVKNMFQTTRRNGNTVTGVVVSAGLAAKTAKVRVGGEEWNKKVQKVTFTTYLPTYLPPAPVRLSNLKLTGSRSRPSSTSKSPRNTSSTTPTTRSAPATSSRSSVGGGRPRASASS